MEQQKKGRSTGWIATPNSGHLRGRKTKDTEPEVHLRKALHARGLRFRLHRQLWKGCTADIVFPGRRVAIFVDGDFWHGCPRHAAHIQFRGPNAQRWRDKIERTRRRDSETVQRAPSQGWTVIRIWECEVRADADNAAQRIVEMFPRHDD